MQAQDCQVREEGAEEAVEAAQVPEEVGDARRRRVHEPQDAAQVPDVVRPLWLTARRLCFAWLVASASSALKQSNKKGVPRQRTFYWGWDMGWDGSGGEVPQRPRREHARARV